MARLQRPYIPLNVRVQVASRQMMQRGMSYEAMQISLQLPDPNHQEYRLATCLDQMLMALFGDEPWHLDHDPPLMLRRRTRAGGYKPDANDPKYLVYRTAQEHKIKTFVRGDGAQLPDAGKRRKEIRRLRKLDPNRRKRNWPKRKMR